MTQISINWDRLSDDEKLAAVRGLNDRIARLEAQLESRPHATPEMVDGGAQEVCKCGGVNPASYPPEERQHVYDCQCTMLQARIAELEKQVSVS